MNNTRERSDAIQTAARALLEARAVDITKQVDIAALVPALVEQTQCHADTAKRHIAKAVRRARGEAAATWGGARPGSGRRKTMGIGNAWPILRCQGPHSWYETYDIPDEVLFGWIDAETPPDRQPQLNQWKRDYVTQVDVTQIGGLIRRNWQEAQQYRVS